MRLEKRGYIPYTGTWLPLIKRDLAYVFLEVKEMLIQKRSIIILVLMLFIMSFPVISAIVLGGWEYMGMTAKEVNRAIITQYVSFSFIVLFLGLVLVAITVSPRFSEDVSGGALPLILSRPITMEEYFSMKVLSSFVYIFTIIGLPPLISASLVMGVLPPSIHFGAIYILSRLLAIFLIYTFFLVSLALFSSSLLRSPTGASLLTFFLPWITEFFGGILRSTLNLPQKYTLISIISGILLTSSSGFVEDLKGSSLTLWHQALTLAILLPVFMLFVAYTVLKERQGV